MRKKCMLHISLVVGLMFKSSNFEIVNIRDIRFDIHPCTPILFSQAFMNSNISIISFGSY